MQPVNSPSAVTVDERIGERVHMLMWRAGLSQTKVGRAIGIEQTLLSKKLRGMVRWYAGEVEAAAQALGVNVDDLYGAAGDPLPPLLPRLDSNQQPSDLRFPQVSAVGKSDVAIADRPAGKVIPLRRSTGKQPVRVAIATPAPFRSAGSAPVRLRASA